MTFLLIQTVCINGVKDVKFSLAEVFTYLETEIKKKNNRLLKLNNVYKSPIAAIVDTKS